MKRVFFALLLCSVFGQAEVPQNSLLNYTWKKYSQSGEEGIISEILSRIGVEDGFFVEFGATDGIFFSNTRFLAERGWKGAFIECDAAVFPKLVENASLFPDVLCIQEYVKAAGAQGPGKTLDEIGETYFKGQEIDVLSIDIDGLDYLILENLICKPKVICIESSGYWHPQLQNRVPDDIASKNLGQPLPVIIEIARQQGYEPVCFLLVNLLLVRRDLMSYFSEIDPDPHTLWSNSWSYIKQHQPDDSRYILQERKLAPWIYQYDTLELE